MPLSVRRLALFAVTCTVAIAALALWNREVSAQKPAAAAPKKPAEVAKNSPVSEIIESSDPVLQRDFPDLCLDPTGTAWTVFIQNDGAADTLMLARRIDGKIERVGEVSTPGVIHQPAIAADGSGAIWCVWGQKDGRNVVTLRARKFDGEKWMPEEEIGSSDAGESFADAGTDASGRVWVCWQKIQPGGSLIHVRHWNPDTQAWSETTDIAAKGVGGNWEPRLAFDADPGAWIAYDSSAGSEFNLRLAHVDIAGAVEDRALTDSPEYEARADIAWDGNGGFWVVAERGRTQWGLDSRGHENDMGLNAHKRLLLGRFDIASGEFKEVPVIDLARPAPSPSPSPCAAVNAPSISFSGGNVWISYRYFRGQYWAVALLRYRPATGAWGEPLSVPNSTMGQDRRCEIEAGAQGALTLAWPSDHRKTKECQISTVHLADVDPTAVTAFTGTLPEKVNRLDEPLPYRNEPTPPRPLDQHHTWTVGGKTYRLCWGDLHRHTDISNCRTGFDGCITEAYRYAYDMAGLDFLGTSDHTDVGKPYHPYEWWHTQRHVDVFYAPDQFNSLYAYEREQKFPWGHRNIVYADHGGPILYINRTLYRNSPWQKSFPLRPGVGEISPQEVWDVLKRRGKSASVISHTGATGMGTDWTRYPDGIDNTYENIVEIFQGARVSYEGIGLHQPTVGMRKGENYTPHRLAGKEHPAPPAPITDFDAGLKNKPGYNNGVYQKALSEGHRLGVFASSDHIATHTSFGGVYVEEFTREGIIAGFNAKRTLAATDKIFVHFSSGDHLIGDAFTTAENPTLEFHIEGTAALKRVTLVRNEEDHQVFEPAAPTMTESFTDPTPAAGENRYYLRIEQADGNMAWTSPLWIQYEAEAKGE